MYMLLIIVGGRFVRSDWLKNNGRTFPPNSRAAYGENKAARATLVFSSVRRGAASSALQFVLERTVCCPVAGVALGLMAVGVASGLVFLGAPRLRRFVYSMAPASALSGATLRRKPQPQPGAEAMRCAKLL